MEAGIGIGRGCGERETGGDPGERDRQKGPKGNLEEVLVGITKVWVRGSWSGTLGMRGRWRGGSKGKEEQAHLRRRGPGRGSLGRWVLLILLLLKLLGQFQVAQTRRALGRGLLLLQGQGDQVVLETGARTRAVREAAAGGWPGWA